ncbi:MAG: SDR family NAD(P)-dependent oxidoreductase [Myxococcales bacterium]|nr:SDR family NAD(P)-dependent oxidoreductase [Myxococcales bacterium]
MAEQYDGKVVWITGGGSGLGRAMAFEFASKGFKIAVSGRRADRLDEVVEALAAKGTEGLAIPCDVTDESDIEAALEKIVADFGHVDVVVANAGFAVGGSVESLSAADWRRQMEVNVVGLTSTIRLSLPYLRETGGRLGLIGSVAGMIAAPGTAAYTASKYAVRAIGQVLSMELYATGVSCTTIHPGFVESEIGQVDNRGKFHEDRKDQRPGKLMWATEDAARVMVKAILKRKREYVFTGHGKLGAFLGMHTPGLVHFVMTRAASRSKALASLNER